MTALGPPELFGIYIFKFLQHKNVKINDNFEEKIRSVIRFFVDDASEEAIKLIRHEVVSMRQLKVS